jgi:adenylylsulfate reductase subunit B
MVLDPKQMKAFNQEPDMCWECYCCVKICPVQAIEVRGYADFMPLGAMVTPLRSTDSIMWTLKFRNGTLKRFKFPIRTTEEGKVAPFDQYPTGDDDLKSPTLMCEPASLNTDNGPVKMEKALTL